MSLSDITCKPLALPCCNEPSVITANGEYFVTVRDNARGCNVRFRFLVDGQIELGNCACSCYRANIIYNGAPIGLSTGFVNIGYPAGVVFEPRITLTTEGACATFINQPSTDIPSPCSFNNIRNISFDRLCVNSYLNFNLDTTDNGCSDTVVFLGNLDFDQYLTITYIPPMSNLHYELVFHYRQQIWQVSSSFYIFFIFVGYSLFSSACYIHYLEYDPFNTKEDYEVLSSLFIGNDLREQDIDMHVIKQLITTRSI